MPQSRNPLALLIIGAVLGGILGAVVGIAIGSTAGRSGGGPVRVQTVVSTRTVRVAGLSPLGSPPLTDATPTVTVTAPVTPPSTATTPTTDTTTATATTPTTDTTTTDTTPTTPDPNDRPPPDPNNPPANFCAAHVCAPGFSHGSGYVAQCADGVWTRQGGQAGACRNDGGLA